MTQALQNNVVSRTGQIYLERVQEAAVYSFLIQKVCCTTAHSTLEAWRKFTFFKQFLRPFSLSVRSCPVIMYIAAGTMRSHGAVTSLGCLQPVDTKIPILEALRGTFSTSQMPRHVRVSWHATSCTSSHTQLWSVRPRNLGGLLAPGWKQRGGCWSLCTLYNHLLSQQANLFCQLWDWITF